MVFVAAQLPAGSLLCTSFPRLKKRYNYGQALIPRGLPATWRFNERNQRGDSGGFQFAAPGLVCKPRGHDNRILRFLYLCDCGGPGISQAVLSGLGPVHGDASLAGDIRNRFSGAAHRVGAFRALRRPYGRKTTLVVALATMGVSTVSIGALPTYHSIGVFAPLLLAICRFGQGLGWVGSGAVPCCWRWKMRRPTSAPGMECFRSLAPRWIHPFRWSVSGAVAITHKPTVFRIRLEAAFFGKLGSSALGPVCTHLDHRDTGIPESAGTG